MFLIKLALLAHFEKTREICSQDLIKILSQIRDKVEKIISNRKNSYIDEIVNLLFLIKIHINFFIRKWNYE